MFESIHQIFDQLLGLQFDKLLFVHMVARVCIVYIVGIFVLNVVNKRFVGENTPFDVILRFIIGSSLASAIVGGSPFWPTLGMVFFMVLLNWLLSLLSFYSRFIEKIVKSEPHTLFRNGEFVWKTMRKYHVTTEDLLSEIRKDGGLASLDDVEEIILEGSGELSVIPKQRSDTSRHKLQRDAD